MLLDSALTAATKLRDSRLGGWKLSISKDERYGAILEMNEYKYLRIELDFPRSVQ